jgi:carbamoyltransferase
MDKLYYERSDIPAVTHIDYSARFQTVHRETNPRFHRLIEHFRNLTGYPVLINTSFNVRGEPIVCSPEEAFICFMRTDMDILVMEDVILEKSRQKNVPEFSRFTILDSPD